MVRKIVDNIYVLFFVLLSMLFSCDNNTVGMDGGTENCGVLSLALQVDSDVETTALKSDDSSTIEDIELDDFIIQVLKDGATYTWYNYDEMPDSINLIAGEYTIKASYGTNPAIAFSSPYYEGKEDVEIIQTQHTDVDITCTLANAMMSIDFTENFEKVYTDYNLIISNKYWTSDDYFLFTKGETRDVYLAVADIELTLILRRYDDELFTYSLPDITDVEARNHYNVTFDVDYEDSAPISVTIDETTNDIVDSYEVSDSWLTKSVPLITGTKPSGTELLSIFEFPTIGSYQVLVSSDVELTTLTIASDSPDFTSAVGGSSVDLVGVEDAATTALSDLGINYSGAIGLTTSAAIRFTEMLETLSVGKHTFTVSASDVYGQSSTYNVTFNVVEDYEFALSAPTGGEVWATKATLSAINYDDITDLVINNYPNVVYEIKREDGSWESVDFNGSITTELTGLSTGTTYSYRATVADRFTTVVDFTTEDALQHNEPSFESWTSKEVYEGYDIGWVKSYPVIEWYANSSTSSSAGYWGTNNPTTCSQDGGVSAYYTGRSGTMSTTDKVSGTYAARISTIGWGEGSTCATSTGLYSAKNVTCGEIRSALNGSDGIPFASRPTSLKFNYKYTPYNSNSMEAYIILENRENSTVEIGRGSLVSGQAVATYKSQTIDVVYNTQYSHLKATHIRLIFRSAASSGLGNSDIQIIEGSVSTINGNGDSYFEGSVLFIDDVELIY